VVGGDDVGEFLRLVFNGYRVVFVPFSGGRPSGEAEDVVTDFLDADGKARGRPVGLAIDKAGALLIADDVGNTVWRATSMGQ
jgi:glucose/arabinose dehydrogenase